MIKKFFDKKWTESFNKHFSGVKALLSSFFVTEDKFSNFHMETYNYLFGIAILAKVKAKDLAEIVVNNGDKLAEFSEELVVAIDNANKPKPEKKSKVAKKAVKKAKNKK